MARQILAEYPELTSVRRFFQQAKTEQSRYFLRAEHVCRATSTGNLGIIGSISQSKLACSAYCRKCSAAFSDRRLYATILTLPMLLYLPVSIFAVVLRAEW